MIEGNRVRFAEAMRCFRRAAEQKLPEAQVNLGFCCETGSGVEADPVAAASWYRKAALGDFHRLSIASAPPHAPSAAGRYSS